MKTLRFATTAALGLALSACGVSPEERMDRAEEAFAEHRFNEARLDLGALLQEDESNPDVLELLARTQLHLGNGEAAQSLLERLAATGQRPEDYDWLLAEAMLLQGENAGALAAGEAAGGAEGLRIAALAHLAQGGIEEAADTFARGAQATGNPSRLYADYARFEFQRGNLSRAIELARQAREADPDGLDALLASGQIAQSRGRSAQALRYFEQAHAAWPQSRAAILGRIGVLGDSGRLDEARPLIEEIARRNPDDPDILYLQARLAAEDGEWSDVRDMLQANEDSEDARQQLLYSRALMELELTEQALPRLAALVRQAPASIEARRLLARAQLDSGNAASAYETIRPLATSAQGNPRDLALYAEAARASGRSGSLEGALAHAPAEERVANLLAQADAHLRNGRWRAAIAAYEQLRGWTGDSNAMVLNNLAYAKSRVGDTDEALAIARRALQLAPDQPNIMDTAGWLMVQSGSDRSRGLQLLERAARMAPDNQTIAAHLAEARGG